MRQPAEAPVKYPLLSFLELAALANQIETRLSLSRFHYRIERMFVPEALDHPNGFFKNEWVLDLYSPQLEQGFQLYFSVRPQQCGLVLAPSKSFRPSKLASRSGFDLSLGKNVVGAKLVSLQAMKEERILTLKISGSAGGSATHELLILLMPALPEAVLLAEDRSVIASSRNREVLTLPEPRVLGPEQLAKIPFRKEWIEDPQAYFERWFTAYRSHALQLRKQRAQQILYHDQEAFARKILSLKEQLDQSKNDPDWNYYGSLLQTHFHAQPRPDGEHYLLEDYERERIVTVPADPKLSLKQQLEKFFHLAKRNRTRLEEATERTKAIQKKLDRLQALSQALSEAHSHPEIKKIETELGISDANTSRAPTKDQKRFSGFSGRQAQSKEGLVILAGRNLAENLEVTFKIAKGNDLWMHVKGRPGSHTVILLPPGRSASLDTLLDAAHLCILYSGGKDWGKTEVDYTPRKNVKKIKNQTEVSYTQNKTLVVTLDPDRLRRLSQQE